MVDDADNAIPKIVDFGLSKILGPNETSTEPFGTVGYVAPEVLQKQHYRESADVWSIGCIIYALLSGSLPYDDKSQSETIRQTIYDPLVFDLPIWDQVSSTAKNLIECMLTKDQHKRVTLDQALKHKWFNK